MDKIDSRLAEIFSYIKDKNHISTKKVIKKMITTGLSEATVRRDIKKLEANGIIKTYYGQIEIIADELFSERNSIREIKNIDCKKIIVSKALNLIEENEVIFVSSSTTGELFASNINRKVKMVVTNGLTVFKKIIKNDYIKEKIIIGGEYNAATDSAIGVFSEDQINNLAFDKIFLSIDQIGNDNMVYIDDFDEAHFLKKVIANSKIKIILADHSKFNATGLSNVGYLANFNVLIHDDSINYANIYKLSQIINIL